MRPSGTTPLRVSEIADLEIRETDTDEVMPAPSSLADPGSQCPALPRRRRRGSRQVRRYREHVNIVLILLSTGGS